MWVAWLPKYSRLAWLAIIPAMAWHAAPAAAGKAAPASLASEEAHALPEKGIASYYGKAHQGKRTASGQRFDDKQLTAAHPWLPFGTRVRVTLLGTGRTVVVVITDRLYSHSRIVDLSLAAARQLGMVRIGVARVSLALN